MLPLWARVNLGARAMKGTPHSPKLEHYWNLTIRSFSIISRTPLTDTNRVIAQLVSVYGAFKQTETEVVFTKTKRNNEETYSLQNNTLATQHTYSNKASVGRGTTESSLLIRFETAPSHFLYCFLYL